MTQPRFARGVPAKLARTGTRRLLALDSGGVRGFLTLEIVAQLEQTLRKALNAGDDFVLADYFDYIGGTSVGGILAACLSLGMSIEQIRVFFDDSARAMFEKSAWWRRLHYKYRCEKLKYKIKAAIEETAGDVPETDPAFDNALGSSKLKTLLLLVMRNATTDSPWPVSNYPGAKFNRDRNDPTCNLRIPLWQLIRASAAAPTFFAPEALTMGSKTFVFDDGAMTPFGNPAFQLFMTATVGPYNLNWPTGEDRMLLVSVGTGSFSTGRAKENPLAEHLFYYAKTVPSVLIGASAAYQDLLCRVFGKCLIGGSIDSELGDLILDQRGPVSPKLFTYLRYDAALTKEGLDEMGLPEVDPAVIRLLDSCENIPHLQAIGKAVATKVEAAHFAGFLDTDEHAPPPAIVPPKHDNRALLDEVNEAGAWFRARKVQPIWVKQVEGVKQVESLEGSQTMHPNDVLCRGASGEVWPQKLESVLEKYEPADDPESDGWRKYVPRSDHSGAMAAQIAHAFCVQTSRGPLYGKPDDYLLKEQDDADVKYPQQLWIVDRELFEQSYRSGPDAK